MNIFEDIIFGFADTKKVDTASIPNISFMKDGFIEGMLFLDCISFGWVYLTH